MDVSPAAAVELRRGRWWAPASRVWWTAVLFAVGSTCFALGAAPAYVLLAGRAGDGITFFVGSVFFTSAAFLQFLESGGLRRRAGAVWWASAVQLVGTVFFNVNTFDGMITGLTTHQSNLLVWTPDAIGSTCFLVASWLAYRVAGHGRDWWIAAVNLLGSVFFGISALAGYVVPSTGDYVNAALVNAGTFLGALCFLAGAVLMLPVEECA